MGGVPLETRAERAPQEPPGLPTVLRCWGRIGCLGFGGPPAHIRLLRELCVERRRWIDPDEFEDAIATCNLLPGPSSTQLAIFTAWRVRGPAGGVVGGLAFIVPGLIAILALAALFLGGPPDWVLGAGAGAGAAVAAVAVHAGWGLTPASWARRESTTRWVGYLGAGALAAALLGPWVVAVLLACGFVELLLRHPTRDPSGVALLAISGGGAAGAGVLLSLAWTSFKVGALSYGFWPGQDRPRSARSTARQCHWPARSPSPGSTPTWPVRPWRCSRSAAAW
jgi:chromate transporter